MKNDVSALHHLLADVGAKQVSLMERHTPSVYVASNMGLPATAQIVDYTDDRHAFFQQVVHEMGADKRSATCHQNRFIFPSHSTYPQA